MVGEESHRSLCTLIMSNMQYIAVIRHNTRVTDTRHCVSSAKEKKLDLDDLNSYRPISNQTFTSKLIEPVIAARFMKHVDDHTLLPVRQLAYHRFHSTETAFAAHLRRAADANPVTTLVLLDLRSAFDQVDHDILLSVRERRFGVDSVALRWFQSYLHDWSQTFMVNGKVQELTK